MAQAGLSPKRSWEQRMQDCQDFYTLARQTGACKKCGAQGVYLKSGRHPSGKGGRPVKLFGPDLDRVKQWIQEAGWVCQRCGLKHEVVAPVVEVKLKPWAPYPPEHESLQILLDKDVERMRTGSDRMGIRTEAEIEAHLNYSRRRGWVSREDWAKEREAPPGGGGTLTGVGTAE